MIAPILARAQLALEENAILRRELRRLRDEQQAARNKLRSAVLESMMQRAEWKAIRDDCWRVRPI